MLARLLEAIEKRDYAFIEGLLKTSQLDINQKMEDGYTLLMLAAFTGDLKLTNLFLSHGASPDVKNQGGSTALKLAALQGHAPIAHLLVKNGATSDLKDDKGFTPLMYAAMNGHLATVKVLLDNGADPTLKSAKGGNTAADFAREKQHGEVAEFLERRGEQYSAPKETVTTKDTAPPEIRDEDLIGQKAAKNAMNQVIALVRVNQERLKRQLPAVKVTLHAAFVGSPGTGKTTFARYYAQEIRKLGLLKTGQLVEVSRPDLVAEYAGQTAGKTAEVVKRALGGILFIDEAYSLKSNKEDAFGQECIDTLLKLIEDHRDNLILILAGYTDEMRAFLHLNPGLKSRIPNEIHFENFTLDELGAIFDSMIKKSGFTVSADNKNFVLDEIASQMRGRNFGNARAVRNLFERALSQQSLRLSKLPIADLETSDLCAFIYSDLTATPDDEGQTAPPASEAGGAQTALGKLGKLHGLAAVKEEVRQLVDFARVTRLRQADSGGGTLNLNLVFSGSPGTGKATVARLLGQIFRECGLISSGHTVETDRSGLVSGYLGQTAQQTREKFQEALGGVLYIAEAYSLCRTDGRDDSYGREAVDMLLKLMGEYAGRVVVVLSGYPDQMDDFLSSNPGLKSSFARVVHFADYSTEELALIAGDMAESHGYVLAQEASVALTALIAEQKSAAGFGGGRTVKNLLEQAYKKQASRILALGKDQLADKSILNTLVADDFAVTRK